jgi:putative spermidine/putrescine transport system ATP-binding protein
MSRSQDRQVLAGSVGEKTGRPKLHAQGLGKTYDKTVALHPIELKIRSGELLTLLGPSGSGKTTFLQLICGLIEPTTGRLEIDGKDFTYTSANQRDIGVVFQNYALFPHLTVMENVLFPLQMRKESPGDARKKAERSLEMVGLELLGKRFPIELSGGQQQRVALARCLVYSPSIILMDESLSALDRKLRESMQIEIKRIHRETGATIVFVTHDQEEALALSDRICLMNGGRIEQLGSPEDIYERPDSAFAANFIGITNLLRGRVMNNQIEIRDRLAPLPDLAVARNGDIGALAIRPEKMRIVEDDAGYIAGVVTETIYSGSETKLLIALDKGEPVTVRRNAGLPPLALGSRIGLQWDGNASRYLKD